MYDELVSGLRYCAGRYGEFESDHQCGLCPLYEQCYTRERTMEEAADAIEELSKQLDSMNEANIALYGALPKWIPVTERLPETDDEVVVAFKNSKDGEWWYRIDNFVDGQFCYNSAFNRHVEYWMPLPEPPKEE